MINFVIVTHGEFGAYMMEAAESIVGRQPRGVRVVSVSPRHPVSEITARIRKAIAEVSSPDGVIFFVDIPGGTPGNLSFPLIKDEENFHMISGVNLYMLITAFNYRAQDDVESLVERIIHSGQKSVRDIRALLQAAH